MGKELTFTADFLADISLKLIVMVNVIKFRTIDLILFFYASACQRQEWGI